MKPKTLILMLVAVGCGLVAAYLASQVGGGASTSNTLPVVVALVDLPAGTMIKEPEKSVMIKPFLADTAPVEGQRLSDIENVRNKTMGRNIAKGEPITPRDFSEQGALFRPAPPGYRAVTIRVTMESALAGFALPGAKVDLVCYRQNPANTSQNIVETFMENVLVLAVNTMRTGDASQDAKNGVVAAPSVVTLAAKPVDAARIIWAKEKGQLTMVLRRPGEEDAVAVPIITELDQTKGGAGGRDKASQMVKVWVARDNVWPGQIDNPQQTFMLDEVPPSMAGEAIKSTSTPPVGKLYSMVAKGMPVTLLHYKPTGETPGGVMPSPKGIVVVQVRDGGKEWKYYKFTADGTPIDDNRPADGAGNPPAGGGTEGAQELK
jgi:Flp pilus assembly protein CpaB